MEHPGTRITVDTSWAEPALDEHVDIRIEYTVTGMYDTWWTNAIDGITRVADDADCSVSKSAVVRVNGPSQSSADREILIKRTSSNVACGEGGCYVSRIFTSTAAARNLRLKRTRPFRPQTNGKAEAFNKIMQAEWAYQRPYYSNRERLNALPGLLAYYNHRRPRGGIGGTTPVSRL